VKGDPLRSQNHDELKSFILGPTNKFFFQSFFQTKNFFFQEQKFFFQGTTIVQFFMYCKAKKNFGAIRKFLKIFDFQKSLSKLGSTLEDLIHRDFDSLGGPLSPCGSHWLR
jgi:hypothetical protein